MNGFLALGDFNAVSEVDSSSTGASSTTDLFCLKEQEKKGLVSGPPNRQKEVIFKHLKEVMDTKLSNTVS